MNIRLQHIHQSVLFLLFPLLTLLLVRSDLNQAGSLDAFFYTAFSNDYVDMVSRYSGYYYSTRLSHILPNALANYVFDSQAAYLFVRYLQLVAATVAIFFISRHYATEIVAWFATLFFCTHVWLLRSLLWDYVDGTVVTYSLIGIAFLLPRKNERWAHFGAGIAFAGAANGNPMCLIIPAGYAATWLIERLDRPLKNNLKSVAACICGFFLGHGLLAVAMLALDPLAGWNFERVTLNAVSSLLSGGASNWFNTLSDIFLKSGFYQPLTLPFFLSVSFVAMFCTGSDSQKRKTFAAFAFMMSTTVIFLIFHFVLTTGALGYSFSLIYALPASVVALSSLLGKWNPRSLRAVLLFGGLFFVAQFSIWWSAPRILPIILRFHFEILLMLSILAFAALFALATPKVNQRSGLFAIILLFVLLASNAFFLRKDTAPIYGDSSGRQTEWDVRNGALYLQNFIARHVPRNVPVRFWYGVRDPYLNSVQSSHLWLTSRLSWPTEAQMPQIDDAVRKRIREEARYIAILGDDGEVNAAVGALRAAGYNLDNVTKGEFKGLAWPGYVVVVGTLQ